MDKIISYIEKVKQFIKEFKDKYGTIGCAAVVLAIMKFIVFYILMSVKSNFILICIISWVITYYLFKSFRNKYIPSAIYLILAILMFADVTYCSYFNKYLSVAMLGSAGMLGDVTASIKQIMRPVNFFMLLDAVVILATVVSYHRKEGGQRFTSFFRRKERNADITETEGQEKPVRDILAELDAMALEESMDQIQEETSKEVLEKDGEEKGSVTDRTELDYEDELENNLYQGRVRRKRAERKRKREKLKRLKVHRNQAIPVVIIILLIVTSTFSPFMQSLAKQEFYTYHVGDVASGALGLSEQKNIMKFEDNYETEKNGPLFGVAKGKNLVVIQVESLQNFTIGMKYNGQEVTPFLNSLLKDKTVYFDHYYQQVGTGNTSDAEFATNNSIMGSIEAFTYQLYEKNYFRGLPWLLKDQGYETAVLHAHENRDFWNRDDIYPALGFDHYYGGLIGDTARPGGNFKMTEWMGWGLTDSEFYPQAMDYIKELQEPFYSFVITLSNHHPYEMLDKYKFIKLAPEEKGTLVGNYLNSVSYTDYALSKLFDEFKKAGLYDDTIFAIYGDHMGLPASDETNEVMGRLLGHPYDWDDRMNIPLIIHIPSADKSVTTTIHNTGGQTDFLPTISYLLGLDHLDTIYLGHNLFTYDKGIVAEHAYLPYGSFFINGYGFEMARDGVFKDGRAWNIKTRKDVDVNQFYDYYMKSRGISDTSVYILQNDILRKVYKDGKSREEVL
ncbi:LTA synthase family protein [Aminipila terrae]|uniref:Sulfatase-like hydrolase/transferase n=1 Tax=Aminipila terrae TaxID=2697030 RepID=A0A6P1MGS5_9FIRM|nr:LTA synthase family protein [Aminipila terrae]QHI73252.1 sulfatase-like hydrolase/transferase [Aminipila terrae]